MPTHNRAYAAVAEAIGEVPPSDADAVDAFYRDVFPSLPEPARALIFDFLLAATEVPTHQQLHALREHVWGELKGRTIPSGRWSGVVMG